MLAVKLETVGFVILGLVLGVVGGLFLYSAVLAPYSKGSVGTLFVTVALCAIIGGSLAYKIWK